MARCVNIAVDIVEKKNIFIIILRIFCTLLLKSNGTCFTLFDSCNIFVMIVLSLLSHLCVCL